MIFAGAWLARRLEAAEAANDADCISAQAGATSERIGSAWALFAGAGSPLTRALGAGLESGPVQETLDAIERFYVSRGARPALDVCPLAAPELLELMERRSYRAVEFNNVLVRGMAGHVPAAQDPHVLRTQDAERWARVVGEGYFDTAELSSAELAIGLDVFGAERSQCFLGRSDYGDDAAGAALSVHEGTAVLFADSTVNRFRRHGLQATLIRHRLNVAVALGCDLACAVTTPGSISQRNYERAGFQVAYTKILMRR